MQAIDAVNEIWQNVNNKKQLLRFVVAAAAVLLWSEWSRDQ